MKFIKYSFLLAAVVSFTSCLKSKEDVGGILDDKGSIVTSIKERQYLLTDAAVQLAGYTNAIANFNFGARPNESVKFFTLSISQPRATKLSGPVTFHVTARDLLPIDPSGYLTASLPAGAVNVTDVTVPASDASIINVPVFYTVNKTLLNPSQYYGARFRLVSASQGAVSTNDSTIDVVFNASTFSATPNLSDVEAQYVYSNDVVDPLNQYGIHQRTARRYLQQISATQLAYQDSYLGVGGANLIANNFTTGAPTAIFAPRFTINAAGQVTGVVNFSNSAAVTNLTLDPTGLNRFTYNNNLSRTLNVKYSFTLTTTINGVVSPRTVTVNEDFTYDTNQVSF